MEQSRRTFLKTVAAASSGAALLKAGLLRRASAEELSEVMTETSAYTYCDGCNHVPMCGIKYFRRGDIVTRFESRTDHKYPANTLCSKGYAQLQEQYHPDRLLYPLKHTNPKGEPTNWKRISWDEAIDTTARNLNEIENKFTERIRSFSTLAIRRRCGLCLMSDFFMVRLDREVSARRTVSSYIFTAESHDRLAGK